MPDLLSGQRFATALERFKASEVTVADLAGEVFKAHQEIMSAGGGTGEVYRDHAVRLLLIRLCRHGDTAAFERNYFDEAPKMEARAAQATGADAALYRDGNFAMNGAVNIGAMMNALNRHAKALASEGVAETDIANHAGKHCILLQCASLAKLPLFAGNEAVDAVANEMMVGCQAVLARQAALRAISEPPSSSPRPA
jgi:hypothetical protein